MVSSTPLGIITCRKTQISVHFPKQSFKTSFLDASLTVLDNDSFYHCLASSSQSCNGGEGVNTCERLATPIVALGPCGTFFDRNVRVTLPLTDGILFFHYNLTYR